jgi:phage/plasmid primase-like uncharacterized protein
MDELEKLLAQTQFDFTPVFDGKFHRFARGSGTEENPNGWFVGRELKLGDRVVLVAHWGDWRTKEKHSWDSASSSPLSDQERAELKTALVAAEDANRKAREKEEREIAAWVTRELPHALRAGEDPPYLRAKGLSGSLYGCLLDADDPSCLLVPLRDIQGAFWSVQQIFADGRKRFLPGGRIKGCFHLIPGNAKNGIYLCEGLATGASIHLATGAPVACAMSAGNLPIVAKSLRAKFPDARIVVAADNDHATAGNPGLAKGKEAAEAIRAELRFPQIPGAGPKETDFNDLHRKAGLEAVKGQLLGAPEPAREPAPVTIEPGAGVARVEAGGGDELPVLVTFNKNGKPVLPAQRQVASVLLEYFNGRIIKQNKDLFLYEGTHWQFLETREIDIVKQKIAHICGGQAPMSYVKEAFEMFRTFCPSVPRTLGEAKKIDLFAPNPFAANFRNGTLWRLRDEKTFTYRLEFRPHRPEDYLINVLPYDYLPEDTTENAEFLAMLDRVFEGDEDAEEKKLSVRQMYGACLMPTFSMLFMCWGPPKTGKSTIINIAKRLVAKENIASVEPSDFHGFSMETLAGKLVNIDTDINTNHPINDAIIKKIIERTDFRIKRKGLKDIEAPIPAVHIFGGNQLPKSFEASTAHERRWVFIHCRKIIQQQKYILDYWDYVYEKSPQGILNFALAGLRDLVESGGHFIFPQSSKAAMKTMQEEGNPVRAFLSDIERGEEITANTRLVRVPNARLRRARLYEIYQAWSLGSGLPRTLTRPQFYRTFEDITGLSTSLLDGYPTYHGIGVAAEREAGF